MTERSRASLYKRLLSLGLTIAACAAILILVSRMSILDRLMVYFPERALLATPADVGLRYDDVYLTAADGVRAHAWHIPGESDVTMLWLHGNAGNISHRLDNIAVLREMTGAGVMILDYRGYGLSDGSPSERGLYADAEAAFAYLTSNLGLDAERDVVLFGRSLGAGVAAELATRHRVRRVILESGFTSIRNMADRSRPRWFTAVVMPMFDARYDTLSKMPSIESPVMIVHGDRDEIIPFDMAETLYAAANEPKRLHRIRGAGHNDTHTVGGPDYFRALRQFIYDDE